MIAEIRQSREGEGSVEAYRGLVWHVLENGIDTADRTGTGTLSMFGDQMRFDLIASERLWFIRGDTNIRFLLMHHNHIGDEWADEPFPHSTEYSGEFIQEFAADDAQFVDRWADLGPIYGRQWRIWRSADGRVVGQLAAQGTDLAVGEFVHALGDAHIHLNPVTQCRKQIRRTPFALADLVLDPKTRHLDQFTLQDRKLEGCQPHAPIRGEISV